MSTTYLPEVAVTAIAVHGNNPRRDVGNVDDLAASIQAHGLLEPLVLGPMNGVEYRLIAGHRRLAAARQAGLRTVPALLREDLDTPPKQLEAMLIENTQRVDLTPVEEADAYAQLVAFPGYTATKAAKATGRSVKVVKSRIALTTLTDAVRDKVHGGQISLADAEKLAALVGTPDYAYAARYVGSSNFAWAMQRAKERQARRATLVKVREVCDDRGWADLPSGQRQSGRAIWPQYGEKEDALLERLRALEPDGPVFLDADDEDGSWSLVYPATVDPDTGRQVGGVHDPAATARRDQEDAARRQRVEDVETARLARIEWFRGTAWQQQVGRDERTVVLRHLVLSWIEDSNYSDEDLALACMPHGDDDNDAVIVEWVQRADEPALWRALCVIALDLARCGWSGEHGHTASIRFAQLFGYEPSDIERELLEPAAVSA